MQNLKRNDTYQLISKQKQTHRQRMNLFLPGGRMGDRMFREFGINKYSLLYLKWITNKNLLYSTGNSAQCSVVAWMGGESGEE